MSADADVNDTLMGPSNGDHVSWYALIARQRMVLLYSPTSRFASAFAAVATGGQGLDAVLNSPGLRLVRDDPTNDPAGYRALFVFELAEGEPLGNSAYFPGEYCDEYALSFAAVGGDHPRHSYGHPGQHGRERRVADARPRV